MERSVPTIHHLPFTIYKNLPAPSLDLALKGYGFLVVGVNLDGAARVGERLRAVAQLKEDAPQEDVRVDGSGLPEDGRLERADGRLLVAQALVDAPYQEEGFGARRLQREHAAQE